MSTVVCLPTLSLSSRYALAGLLSLVLSACALTDEGQLARSDDHTILLHPGQTVGQTFVPLHSGLNGIKVWIDTRGGARGTLSLRLRSDPESSEDLVVSKVLINEYSESRLYSFVFPKVDVHSRNGYRYFFLSWDGQKPLAIGAAPGDRYLNGAAYVDHRPLPSHQLAFHLTYDWLAAGVGLFRASLKGAAIVAISAILYLLPGYAILAWTYRGDLFWPARMGLAAGLSTAIYPIILLWASLFGLRLGSQAVFLMVGLAAAMLAGRYYRWRPRFNPKALVRSNNFWPDLVFIFSLTLIVINRLSVIYALPAPMWGDSYQHSVITQLILDNGGLFNSWQPYTPYNSFTVHFGFSAISALLGWALGNHDGMTATMLAGQVMNGLAVVALYPLATVLFPHRSPWVGTIAVLISGLILPIPTYYTNWGRYAQLSSQVVLPVVLTFMTLALTPSKSITPILRLALPTGLCIGGALLHYYRAPLYFISFIISILIIELIKSKRIIYFANYSIFIFLSVLISITIIFPKAFSIFNSSLFQSSQMVIDFDYNLLLQSVIDDYRAWFYTAEFIPMPVIFLTLISLILAIFRKESRLFIVVLWIVFLFIGPSLRLIRLPATNLLQSFATIIALYIQCSFMVAWLVEIFITKLNSFISSLILVLISIFGFINQFTFINVYNHALITYPDLYAMNWLKNNTSKNSLFLIQGYTIYKGRSIVGSDAGWWLPLLARRSNTIPPQYAILNEKPDEHNYSAKLVELIALLEKHSLDSPEARRAICAMGVTHLFSGQRQGLVGADVRQLFSPSLLQQTEGLVPIYQRDRVIVASLDNSFCYP